MQDHKRGSEPNDKPIETASATTSHDNSNSGPFAYVITAVVLVLSIIMSLAASGCISYAIATAAHEYSNGRPGTQLPDIDDFDNLEDLDELLERYYGDSNPTSSDRNTTTDHGSNAGSSGSSTTSVGDALDFDLAAYGQSIDSMVSASSYAGTPAEVRDFVRDLVSKDRTFADAVCASLNSAALDEGARAGKISEAKDKCAEAAKALDGVSIPAVAGDDDGKVKDALGTAKSNAVRRWELMANEIELLQGESVNTKALWDVDGHVLQATEDAANNLTEAMSLSAR